jgi:hypothetical protein
LAGDQPGLPADTPVERALRCTNSLPAPTDQTPPARERIVFPSALETPRPHHGPSPSRFAQNMRAGYIISNRRRNQNESKGATIKFKTGPSFSDRRKGASTHPPVLAGTGHSPDRNRPVRASASISVRSFSRQIRSLTVPIVANTPHPLEMRGLGMVIITESIGFAHPPKIVGWGIACE